MLHRASISWPFFLTSLVLHTFVGFVVMHFAFSAMPHSVPKVLFVSLIEERAIPQPKPEPIPVQKKKKEIPRPRKEDTPHPLPKLQGKDISPLPSLPEPKAEEKPETGKISEREQMIETGNPLKRDEDRLQNAEKQEKTGAPVPGIEADLLALKPSAETGKLPATGGATWLGETGGAGKRNPGGEDPGESGKTGKATGRVEKWGGLGWPGEGKGAVNLSSYVATARMKIERAKRYPRMARRMGYEGKVVVSFQIDEQGKAGDIKLVRSCGYSELDEEAMATLRRASPFPSPLLIEKEKLTLEVPILFKLE